MIETTQNPRPTPVLRVAVLGAGADAWGRQQPEPGGGPPEVALLDGRGLLPNRSTPVAPWSGGCCGMIPAGEMKLACACGVRVGYVWSECAMYAVMVLRLDRVREVLPPPRRAAGTERA